jgi:putative proteasome-type protease
MTFCLGIKLSDGLVGIADTRVLSGNEMVVARKVSVYQEELSIIVIVPKFPIMPKSDPL